MLFERRQLRQIALSGLFLGLLAVSWFLASGVFKTALFLLLSIGGIAASLAFWPEMLVMAYLFAGRYGYEARLAPGDIPISLNQMILVGLVVLALLNLRFVIRVLRRWSMLGLIAFSVALLMGLGWTLGLNYGLYKVTRTWLVIVPAILIAGALLERRGSVVPLIAAAFAVGFALNSAGLLTFEASLSSNNRLSALGSGPNVFARTVGLSMLIALLTITWLLQRGLNSTKDRLLVLGAGLAFLWLLPGFVLAQSRGPALALLAAVGLLIMLSLYGNWRTVIVGLGSLTFTFWAGSLVANEILGATRFDLSKKSNQVSVDARFQHLWDTWDLIVEHPLLGIGTGAWPVHLFGIDERAYPHNFFAEIAVENGVFLAGALGLVFFVVIGRGFLWWLRARDPYTRFVLMGTLAVWLFFMINISVTGDSVDNRLIWLTLLAVEIRTWAVAREAHPSPAVPAPVAPGPRSAGP